MTITSMQLFKLLLIIWNCRIKEKLGGFCLRMQGSPQTILKVFCTIKLKKCFCVLQKTQHHTWTHVPRLYSLNECLLIAL